MPYEITQCYLPPGRGDFPAFTPAEAKLVLDLATPEGCKAELTWFSILRRKKLQHSVNAVYCSTHPVFDYGIHVAYVPRTNTA